MQLSNVIKKTDGQALTMLLVFVIIAMTITASAVAVMVTNSLGASKFQQGVDALTIAESGVENAFLRLLRDPKYSGTGYNCSGSCTAEPVLQVDSGTTTTSVAPNDGTSSICSAPSTLTITTTGTAGNFVRKIRACATYVNNTLTVNTWSEIF